MRLIDEKGRLFGKVNVIDFLVILFLFCMLPVFYFGYKILNRPVVEKKIEEISTSVDVYAVFKNLDPEVANLISVEDKEIDKKGNVIGEILDVSKIESNFIEIDLGEGGIIIKEDSQRKQATVKIRVIGRIDGNDIFYKEKKVKIDSSINFKTDKYEAKAIIILEHSKTMDVSQSGFSAINLDLLFKNLSPEIARLISEGDFEIDENGDTIVKVSSLGKPEPYSYRVDLGGGNYVTRTDSQKRQVLAIVEIMGRIEGNAFYFRDKRIALDSVIEFNTNKYNIEGIITKEPALVKKIDKKWAVLKVKFTNLIPELASCINEDDEERNVPGVLLAKVTSILSNEPTETITMVLGQDIKKLNIKDTVNINLSKRPTNRDVILLMGALCVKTQKNLLFKESRVKIGNDLLLRTDEYDIKGVIVGIEEIRDL